ncbi:Transmembrane 9 superfamily member [Aphelenchoides fujianensis]|nr:Transmembrane 9 superfamily member [Aphelenchoides fujianensis]
MRSAGPNHSACCRTAVLLVVLFGVVRAFYLPGLAPVNFCEPKQATKKCPSNVTLFVNKLDSDQSVIPLRIPQVFLLLSLHCFQLLSCSFSFDFCVGSEEDSPVENLGQVLFGERIRPSPYSISFKQPQQCALLCEKEYDLSRTADQERIKLLQRGMKLNYQHHWIIDNMPVTFCFINQQNMNVCTTGFPMGCYGSSCFPPSLLLQRYYLFNHVDIKIEYRDMSHDPNFLEDNIGGRIIRIKVQPRSIKHDDPKNLDCSLGAGPQAISPKDKKVKLTYTYSIVWEKTDVKWSSRWDYILDSVPNSSIQWFSMCVHSWQTASIISFRLQHEQPGDRPLPDGNGRNDPPSHSAPGHRPLQPAGQRGGRAGGVRLEVGPRRRLPVSPPTRKNVQPFAFSPPKHPLLLSVFVGAGSQLLLCSSITLLFACLGFLSPANRGALMTFALVFYVLFGIVSGYVSARLYKMMDGINWKTNIILTSTLVPGILFSIFFLTNTMLWAKGSSGKGAGKKASHYVLVAAAVPFGTLVALLSLWLFISIPLSFRGLLLSASRRPSSRTRPARTPSPARCPPRRSTRSRCPACSWFVSFWIETSAIECSGRHPSVRRHLHPAVLHPELHLGPPSVLHVRLPVARVHHPDRDELRVDHPHHLLHAVRRGECPLLFRSLMEGLQDYRWAWRSFFTSGFTAVYLFAYCVHYLSKLSITGTISTILYFCYTGVFVFLFFPDDRFHRILCHDDLHSQSEFSCGIPSIILLV